MIISFVLLIVSITIHYFYSKKKQQEFKMKQLKKYYKKKEKKRRKVNELLYLLQEQKKSPRRHHYGDSLLGTPQRSHHQDYSSYMSSGSKAEKANRLWELNNSTLDRPPILKKYRSDTSTRKEDSKVRFKGYKDQNLDSEIVPQKLDFSDAKYDSQPFKRSSRRNYNESEVLEANSKEKGQGLLEKYFPDSYRISHYDSDSYSPRRVQDLRYIDKHSREISSKWDRKESHNHKEADYTSSRFKKAPYTKYSISRDDLFN